MKHGENVRNSWSGARRLLGIFPKCLGHLKAPRLAALLRDIGFDACNAIIRSGYWVTPEGLASELPQFVKAMRQEGLVVHFATTGYSAPQLVADDSPLALLAENGITDFRMGYFGIPADGDPRLLFQEARRQMEQMAALCERHGLRAVYQLHHGMLVSNSWSAWRLVDGLPARQVGVEIDPGNQSFEGNENWRVAARLLGEYLAAVGVKDTDLVRDPAAVDEPGKGWRRSWCPIHEGVTNWREVLAGLDGIGFAGPLIFMPFYDSEDRSRMTTKLRLEVAYMKRLMQEGVSK